MCFSHSHSRLFYFVHLAVLPKFLSLSSYCYRIRVTRTTNGRWIHSVELSNLKEIVAKWSKIGPPKMFKTYPFDVFIVNYVGFIYDIQQQETSNCHTGCVSHRTTVRMYIHNLFKSRLSAVDTNLSTPEGRTA